MSARERVPGGGRVRADTQVRPYAVKEAFRSQRDRCQTQPSPAGRGGARPLQWGPEPGGRGGALPPPGFLGLMEATKDSVGADLCVGP